MLRAIAIDDEPIALDIIQNFANKVPFLSLEKTFLSAKEALVYWHENPCDLVFLDINMPDITGLEVAQIIDKQTLIVFTTAYSEHAVKGFELEALDYLLKPFEFGRFMQTCNRAYEKLSPNQQYAPYIFVKDGYHWVRIVLDDLLYVESDGNYLNFVEKNRKVLSRMTIAEALKNLPERAFCRVHKSYIVALDKIEKLEKQQVIIATKEIPLSINFKEELELKLNL